MHFFSLAYLHQAIFQMMRKENARDKMLNDSNLRLILEDSSFLEDLINRPPLVARPNEMTAQFVTLSKHECSSTKGMTEVWREL
jgi:hypothetical protein